VFTLWQKEMGISKEVGIIRSNNYITNMKAKAKAVKPAKKPAKKAKK